MKKAEDRAVIERLKAASVEAADKVRVFQDKALSGEIGDNGDALDLFNDLWRAAVADFHAKDAKIGRAHV